MAGKKFKTKYPGVRARKHATRKHGVRFDECYFIRYRVDGKQVEEMFGWLSQKKPQLTHTSSLENSRTMRGAGLPLALSKKCVQ